MTEHNSTLAREKQGTQSGKEGTTELTISLILRLHVHERVKVDIAMEVDVGLDAPVPAVLLEELVFEEELLSVEGQVSAVYRNRREGMVIGHRI